MTLGCYKKSPDKILRKCKTKLQSEIAWAWHQSSQFTTICLFERPGKEFMSFVHSDIDKSWQKTNVFNTYAFGPLSILKYIESWQNKYWGAVNILKYIKSTLNKYFQKKAIEIYWKYTKQVFSKY